MKLISPKPFEEKSFSDAEKAWLYIDEIYQSNTKFIRQHFKAMVDGKKQNGKVRAFYPKVEVKISSYKKSASSLPYGFLHSPGVYSITITATQLYKNYLIEQLGLVLKNHGGTIEVSQSNTPIPLHYAANTGNGSDAAGLNVAMRDLYDAPDLGNTDDEISNGTLIPGPDSARPLAAFTAPRIDYSLQRLNHYTATDPVHFQNFVIFTNYQFYIDEFCRLAKTYMKEGHKDYERFVEPGNVITHNSRHGGETVGSPLKKLPQMPAYHLVMGEKRGITMINIGVGPSNAKTATDHVAVLRPHAWLMLGHCAGLRNSQSLGDYVLGHAYMREDHVLDSDLPLSVPIPALAEVQVALEDAITEVTTLKGIDRKRIMRTGTVATVDNRNWELWNQKEVVRRLSQSRAIALDMESATIAANGFRFRIPYGTLLCVSDKPLHGELKLPGMASNFYKTQVNQHLKIGLKAMEILREQPAERIHSRKLRSFAETAFQ